MAVSSRVEKTVSILEESYKGLSRAELLEKPHFKIYGASSMNAGDLLAAVISSKLREERIKARQEHCKAREIVELTRKFLAPFRILNHFLRELCYGNIIIIDN
jgi:hypothetical protein